jgi:hypothetical protein
MISRGERGSRTGMAASSATNRSAPVPGRVLARRDGAICIGTIDGAVWISHLKAKD